MTGSAQTNLMRAEEHQLAIEVTGAAFDTIEGSGREPDLWERQSLAEAVGAIFRGAYSYAVANARLAVTPEYRRSPDAKSDESYLHYDLGTLRKAFAVARTEPLLTHPILGPIAVR